MRPPKKKALPLPKSVVTARMPEEGIDFYRYFLVKDFEPMYFKEEDARFWSGGLDQVRRINKTLRWMVKSFKEFSAQRLKEYEAKGYLEYCPTEANLPNNSDRADLIG